ncbi:SDR family oxidoreductase [Actinomycetospora corticicola]|uniref:NAD(P)-dependent dehydrogenase (Short-subunit alcohol dehydrogenase family) n=1 Tax=Actinomycetospora corticicola TaxID=663602 RepID=A0A7Y9E2A4_9PSEU|nr:SDR family oxidoreductase [Actinomycetospora corticicola]NYD39888.1 NAD(P)-dependent dehydrogenase (short-subunit alcohol dehydrogenase family) [Actinomycetospora corticicola]
MTDPGTVLITGGSSGLGAAVAEAVANAGGTPVVLDLKAPDAGHAFVEVDLADPVAAQSAVARAIDEHGALDGVVTAAGIDRCGRIVDVEWAEWERVVAVNLLGTAAVVRAALPSLEERHGTVVTVSSTLGVKAVSDASAYCASKFGVVGFTRAIAAEWAGKVGVTLLVPGGMWTHFFDDRPEQYKPGPDAQLNDPAQTAEAVLFALTRPPGSEVRELLVAASGESSYP